MARARIYVFLGLVALLFASAPAVTQQPGSRDGSRGGFDPSSPWGGWGKRSRNASGYDPSQGGGWGKGSRGSMDGGRGGFDRGSFDRGGRGFDAGRGPGGFDRGGWGGSDTGGRGPGGFSRDPNDLFDRISGGRNVINI